MSREPLVSVIIPVYNKEALVARAIQSVADQTYKNIEIVVVNDGSTDGSEREARLALENNPHVASTYVQNENSGVAIARNTGVFDHSSGELVLCLDADDALGPRNLELLVPEIMARSDIGVSYTALLNINRDGSRKVSPWPRRFDAKEHFYNGFNQVHTAALTRRAVWDRLGGQRQRYAPYGAGAEDGDFWLRAGAYGFDIVYVHPQFGEDCMFHYTTQQGAVSGNQSYSEVDWRSWSPWTKNPNTMPTASIAPATRWSHPARRYDEPTVSVIIPVGPGHAKHLVDALDSLDAQTIRRWEAIVVFDIDKHEQEELLQSGKLDRISRTWPFCRFTSTYANGKLARELTDTIDIVTKGASLLAGLPAGKPRGAGAARNAGIKLARAPLLIFLDADDYFMPTALEKMIARYRQEKKIIFAEHYGIAPIKKEDLHLVHGEVVSYNDKSGLAVIKQGVANYDCKRAAEQPYTDGRVPYIICNVSSLIPRKWALELGGFPENLSSWEDVLFWWMASWKGYCFSKINEPLLVYRYHTGLRRELGRANASALLKYIKEIRKGFKDMGCGCTEGAAGAGTVIDSYGAVVPQGVNMATLALSRGSQLAVNDSDLVQVVFEPKDKGDKMRYGQHNFGGGNFIKYGRLSGGEMIFVHKLDFEADASIARNHPNRGPNYRIIEAIVVDEPFFEDEVLPPAEILEDAFEFFDTTALEKISSQEDSAPVEDYFPEPVEGNVPRRITPVEDFDTGDLRNPGRYVSLLNDAGINNAFEIVRWNREHEGGLEEIDGIGPKAAKVFSDVAKSLV